MLYERFWQWLTFHKRRNCTHEWKKIGSSSELLVYNLYYYNHFKCSECGKKKKSVDSDKTKLRSGRYMYL